MSNEHWESGTKIIAIRDSDVGFYVKGDVFTVRGHDPFMDVVNRLNYDSEDEPGVIASNFRRYGGRDDVKGPIVVRGRGGLNVKLMLALLAIML